MTLPHGWVPQSLHPPYKEVVATRKSDAVRECQQETSRGPRIAIRGLCCLLAVLFSSVLSHPLFAHNPPEEYYDRNITVTLEPACVRVHYRAELSQVSVFSLPDHDRQ